MEVTHINWNAGGKPMSRRNANPIIYTRVYDAVFPVGEGMEVSYNRVEESNLTTCNIEGN